MDRTFFTTILFLATCFTIISLKADEIPNKTEGDTCGNTMTTTTIEDKLKELNQ